MTKLLTPQEYAVAARRTQKAQHWQAGIMEACFGICGETAELFMASGMDVETHRDEMGDVLWYVCLFIDRWNDYANQHGAIPLDFDAAMRWAYIPPANKSDATAEAMANAGLIADAVKKWVYHGKDIDILSIQHPIEHLLRCLWITANLMEFRMGEAMAANIAKLQARHPDGFDPAYHANGVETPVSAGNWRKGK